MITLPAATVVQAVCLASIVNAAAGVIGIVVIALYLSPAEVGLAAMVAPLVIFVVAVSDVALGRSVEHAASFDHDRSSQRFWRTLAISAPLSAVFVGLAPTLGWIFGTLDVLPVAIALAPLFLLEGIKAEHNAVCRSCGRHDLWAWASGTGAVAGLVAAVVLADGGAGVFALIGMLLVRTGTHAVLIWAFTGWVPGRLHGDSFAPARVRRGASPLTNDLLVHATQVIDKVMLGATKGAASVGSYHLAYQIVLIPLFLLQAPVRDLAIRDLRTHQANDVAFLVSVQRITATLAVIVWPVMVACALVADLAIPALFGDGWSDSGQIFCLLALATLPLCLRQIIGWVLEARGESARANRWHLTGIIAICAGVVIGLPWGGLGVASGLLIAELAVLSAGPLTIGHAHRGLPTTLARALARPLALSALATFAAIQVRMVADAASDGVALALIGILMISIAVLSLWQAKAPFIGHPAVPEASLDRIKDRAKAGRPNAAAP